MFYPEYGQFLETSINISDPGFRYPVCSIVVDKYFPNEPIIQISLNTKTITVYENFENGHEPASKGVDFNWIGENLRLTIIIDYKAGVFYLFDGGKLIFLY